MKDAYFHARAAGDTIETSGTPSCTLGHPLVDKTDGEPKGIFLEWHWDGERLTARTDRYGLYPALYFQRDGEICISPNIYRLLDEGAPAEYDYPALAAFLHYQTFIGEDTPFKHIRALPPGARLEWKPGRFTISSSMPGSTAQSMTREEALEGYVHYFRQAMDRRLPPSDDFAVMLTGGRDSRRILFELCRRGLKPRRAVTVHNFAFRADEDAVIAPIVANAAGVRHELIEQDQSRFKAERKTFRQTNLCSGWHQWMLALAKHFEERGTGTVYDGLWGDIASHSQTQTPGRLRLIEAGRFADLASALLTRQGRWIASREKAIRHVLSREESDHLSRDAAMARVTADLPRHADAVHPLRSWKMFNSNRRNTALYSFGVLSEIPNLMTPYLDHDLLDFLDSLPRPIIRDKEFREDGISLAYPRFAHLRYERRGPPDKGAAAREYARFAQELAWHVLTHRWTRRVREGRLIPRLIACLLSERRAAAAYWFAPMVHFLLQIEAAATRR